MRLVLALLLMLGSIQAQDATKWNLDVLQGFGKFSLDGEYSIFEAPLSGGVQYDAGFSQVGIFLTLAASGGEEDRDDSVDLGAMFHINFLEKQDSKIVQRLGVGAGVDFWRTAKGLRFDEEFTEIFFFSVTFDL